MFLTSSVGIYSKVKVKVDLKRYKRSEKQFWNTENKIRNNLTT